MGFYPKNTDRRVKMLTGLVGYRTYITSFLIALFGVLQMTDWNSFFDNPGAGMVAIVSALLMAVLRTFTTTPPGMDR